MKDSKIAWTDHTFNPWWGCEKVSPACTNCYAEAFSKRVGQPVWGKSAPRRFFKDKHWLEPHRWDIEAKRAGERQRVFCASMADVFEARKDLDSQRDRLWALIEDTTGLDWLLLTKRPENIPGMIPPAWMRSPRPNVWFGTTVENQEWADRRIPALMQVPAAIRFLSIEPLLGPIDLSRHFRAALVEFEDRPFVDEKGIGYPGRCVEAAPLIHWAIVGGESGGRARPFEVNAARILRDECRRSKVSFFMKQLGAMPTLPYSLNDRMGGDPSEWPVDLHVREFPILK